MNICIIPARKGSKRLKNKNSKIFCGKPIIEQVIQNIKKTKFFSKIIISTDSKKILKIAKKNKVHAMIRSKYLSGDNIPIKLVILNVIKEIKKNENLMPKKVCCVFPTSVFFSKIHIKKANKLLKNNINYVFSAVKYSHPIQRSFYKKNNKIKMNFKNVEEKLTQKFHYSYYDAAQFYFGWTSSWIKKKSFFEGKNRFVEFKDWEVQDIDTKEDLKNAEIKFKNLNKYF